MAVIFYKIYEFFKKQTLLFGTAVFLFLTLFAYLASQLNFNEDSEALLPDAKNLQLANDILKASGLSDRMIMMVHNDNTNPDNLIQTTSDFINQIDSQTNSYIKAYKVGLQEDNFLNIYNEVLANLPMLLDSADLQNCKSKLTASAIAESIESGYKKMLSPAGVMWRTAFINDPLGLAGIAMQKLNALRSNEAFNLHQGYLMDAEKETVFLFLDLKYSSNETVKNAKFLKLLDKNITAFNSKIEIPVDIYYYGAVPVSVGNANQIKWDINVTVTIALLILSIFFAFYFRSIIAFFIVFLPAVFGALTSIGIISITGQNIAVISLGIGAVLLGITVDYSLHVLIHLNKNRSKKKMFSDLTSPILMSSLTTAIAFLCLKIINTKAIGDLGLFAGLSVFAAAIATLILLPQLFNPEKKSSHKAFKDPFYGLANFPYHEKKYWVLSLFIITGFLLFFVPKVSFVSNMEQLNFLTPKLKTAENLLYASTGSQNEKIYAITQNKDFDKAISENQKFISQLDDFKTNQTITNFESVQDFLVSKEEQEKRIKNWNNFWQQKDANQLEQQIDQIASQFKIKQGTFQSFIDRISNPISVENSQFNLPSLEKAILNEYVFSKDSTHYIINIITTPKEQMEMAIHQLPQQKNTHLINLKQSTSSYVAVLKNDLNKLAWLTFIIIFVILLILFGRIELAILTIIPIVLSWIWTLGIMGLLGVQLNITNIIITTFVFGLGVDYAIFITKGILHQYTYDEEMLIDYKRGIFLSCLTTVIGLGALIFAQHPALKSIAAVSIIGILSTVIITTSILPFLLKKLLFDRPTKGNRPYTLRISLSTWYAYFYFVLGCLVLAIFSFVFQLTPVAKKQKKRIYHKLVYVWIYSLVHKMFHIKKEYINKPTDQSQAIYIANHQSFLDILFMLLTHSKCIMLTNNWVWNSPFFGRVVRYADFYPVANGVEESVDHLKELVDDGYSIIVFPEGTRSKSNDLGRFRKGSFYLSEALKLDIVPVLLHGTGDSIRKNDLMINSGHTTIKYLEKIKYTDRSWGEDYNERGKSIRKFFKEEYSKHRSEKEHPRYFKNIVNSNYIYKTPWLPYYIRTKLKLANYFEELDNILPKEGHITDIGCGYGYMDYILHLSSPKRKFTAIDYDEKKVKLAQHNYINDGSLEFIYTDALKFEIPQSDAIIIWDVLHYFTKEEQFELLDKCQLSLNENGMIIIRDGVTEDHKNHSKTKLTEWISTNFGFNKSLNPSLSFIEIRELENYATKEGFSFEIISKSERTSNHLILLKK